MIYRFEEFSINTDRRELRRGSVLVAVEPQVFDLLQYLIRNRDHIVSKDDLVAGVWDGRIVSESTMSSRIWAARRALGDNGKGQRLIRTIPRKGFCFIGPVWNAGEQLGGAGPRPIGAAEREALPKSNSEFASLVFRQRPSIAVLPFANISGDSQQECFVKGVVEDITTALSQFRWLSVIVHRSSFADKGPTADVKELSRELGVRYLLRGSMRKAANRVRIAAQLIDTTTESHLWASHFDGDLGNVFDLQDQITAAVVGAIAPELEHIEIERTRRIPTEELDAYACTLRGMGSLYRWTRGGINQALQLFHKAIQIDPEFPSAYGMAAYCYVQLKSNGWLCDRLREVGESARLARQAAELANGDAVALSRAAHAISSIGGDIDSGAAFIGQALVLNPHLSTAWYVSGWINLFLGEQKVATEHLTHAIQLSPLDPLIFKTHAALAYAHLFAGRYDDASAWAENALHARPNYLTAVRGAAASHALAGRLDKAQKLIAHMRELDPALRISNLGQLIPLRRPEDFNRWADGLQKAGLPA